MEHLWTPWRYSYVTGAAGQADAGRVEREPVGAEPERRKGVAPELSAWKGDFGCVFCNLVASTDDAVARGARPDEAERASLLVVRSERVFLCLNRFPYNSGHLMVVPYAHGASLAELPTATANEIMAWAQRAERALEATYTPDGFNMGLNLGAAAGAGVAEHLHLHAVPRWIGDTSFLTTLGETRTLPEALTVTWERLRDALAADVLAHPQAAS